MNNGDHENYDDEYYDDIDEESLRINELEKRTHKIEDDLSDAGHMIGRTILETHEQSRNSMLLTCLIYLPGLVMSLVLSWSINHSIILAVSHGYLSWGYVIYYAVQNSP